MSFFTHFIATIALVLNTVYGTHFLVPSPDPTTQQPVPKPIVATTTVVAPIASTTPPIESKIIDKTPVPPPQKPVAPPSVPLNSDTASSPFIGLDQGSLNITPLNRAITGTSNLKYIRIQIRKNYNPLIDTTITVQNGIWTYVADALPDGTYALMLSDSDGTITTSNFTLNVAMTGGASTPVNLDLGNPYKKSTADGTLTWNCAAGTWPNNATGECTCITAYKQTSTDSSGRRVCTYTPPGPVYINLISPLQPVTITRDSDLAVTWTVLSGDPEHPLTISLDGADSQYGALATTYASLHSTTLTISTPPGTYQLNVAGSSSTLPKTTVVVIGPPEIPDATYSTLTFDGNSKTAEIIADSSCHATVNTELTDYDDYSMIGKTVTLVSSRGTVDTILPQALVTDKYGDISFNVISSVPGTSILTLYMDGIPLTTLTPLQLTVDQVSGHDCSN